MSLLLGTQYWKPSDELLENKDIKILLKTMHYEDIKIEDTIAWDVYNCNSEDVIDDEIETILDTIVVDKSGRIYIKTTKRYQHK